MSFTLPGLVVHPDGVAEPVDIPGTNPHGHIRRLLGGDPRIHVDHPTGLRTWAQPPTSKGRCPSGDFNPAASLVAAAYGHDRATYHGPVLVMGASTRWDHRRLIRTVGARVRGEYKPCIACGR
ncbi:hypothetical protein [Allonocardiopsis opalescens]|uniref:Uncharacterized protein n=1 Tax=Allonocardiopsis opalescens TaxID=1144618 RepID=A0A2T0PT07_9ACTN|nr:hypothetical protein [Allonocardiopsis opalescens]PRX92030.1 hypothetical protein CLV72_112103 [Allonocardiopsis opalescens]